MHTLSCFAVPGPPRKPLGAEVGADMEAMSCKEERNLSAVDSTLTAENKEAFKEWKKHDDRKEYFCELDGKFQILNHGIKRDE